MEYESLRSKFTILTEGLTWDLRQRQLYIKICDPVSLVLAGEWPDDQGCFPGPLTSRWDQVFNSSMWDMREGDVFHFQANVSMTWIPSWVACPSSRGRERTLRLQGSNREAQNRDNTHLRSIAWRTVPTEEEYLYRCVTWERNNPLLGQATEILMQSRSGNPTYYVTSHWLIGLYIH